MDVRPDTHSYDPLGRLSSETSVITGEAAVSVAENHRYFVVAPALGHQIELAVAIEISGGDSVGVGITQHRNRRTGRGSESAVSVTQQDGEGFLFMVGKCQIEDSVSVEVGDANIVGRVSGRKGRALGFSEFSFAVAQQDGDGVVGRIGYGDVRLAVTIKVGDHDAVRPFAYRDLGDCRRVSWPLRLRRTTDEPQKKPTYQPLHIPLIATLPLSQTSP